MKTNKANINEWRLQVMKSLNLDFIVKNNKIIYKGDLMGYNSLVSLLVGEGIKLGIS